MPEYAFETIWRIASPIHDVWEAIYHAERWPTWWRGVERVVVLEPGDENGVGSVKRYTWKSALPYRLTLDMRTVKVEPPTMLEAAASGELEGTGCWTLSGDDTATTARYEWRVRTTKRWMNLLAPLARPLFEWNHHVVMRQGGRGLARLLKAPLLAVEARPGG